MKDFHAWLTDITNDLRAQVEPPRPEPEALPIIDPNSIHDALISAIKSIAWRAQHQIPMEDRIRKKIKALTKHYSQVYDLMEQEVKQGSRLQNELDELAKKTGNWLYNVTQAGLVSCKAGEIPAWPHKDQYVPFHIKH